MTTTTTPEAARDAAISGAREAIWSALTQLVEGCGGVGAPLTDWQDAAIRRVQVQLAGASKDLFKIAEELGITFRNPDPDPDPAAE